MTVREAWIQMCADYLEGNPEAKGLGYVVDAITGGQGGGILPKPLTAVSLANYLEQLADAHDTWRQIVALMTEDLEEGDELEPDGLMCLSDLNGSGLEIKYEDSWMPRMQAAIVDYQQATAPGGGK